MCLSTVGTQYLAHCFVCSRYVTTVCWMEEVLVSKFHQCVEDIWSMLAKEPSISDPVETYCGIPK